MIEYQNKYVEFIKEKGVGSNDVVADSVKSYISYLNGVSKHLGINVSPSTLSSENDIQDLAAQLEGKVSAKTINNYRTAMAQYINMVSALNLKAKKRGQFDGGTSDPFSKMKLQKRGQTPFLQRVLKFPLTSLVK